MALQIINRSIDTDDIDTSFPIFYLYRYFGHQYVSIRNIDTIGIYRHPYSRANGNFDFVTTHNYISRFQKNTVTA